MKILCKISVKINKIGTNLIIIKFNKLSSVCRLIHMRIVMYSSIL